MPLQAEIVEWAAFYEHRLCEGQKSIFHLEAFAAKVMAVQKNFVLTAFQA
jgi:replication factor C subunit 3/5